MTVKKKERKKKENLAVPHFFQPTCQCLNIRQNTLPCSLRLICYLKEIRTSFVKYNVHVVLITLVGEEGGGGGGKGGQREHIITVYAYSSHMHCSNSHPTTE